MSKKKPKPKNEKAMPFEDSYEQLKNIVVQLEDGNLTLSESLEVYENGVKNLKSCYRALEEVQKRIELLVEIDSDGNLVTQAFDDMATQEPLRKTARHADTIEAPDADSEEDIEDEDSSDVDDPDRLF